jgi:hypothetical protein
VTIAELYAILSYHLKGVTKMNDETFDYPTAQEIADARGITLEELEREIEWERQELEREFGHWVQADSGNSLY